MNPSIVNVARNGDRGHVIATLVLAFARDPFARWVYPEPHQYLEHGPTFTNVFGGKAFDHDSAHYAPSYVGASLWLPPGVEPDEEQLVGHIERTVDERRLGTMMRTVEQMGRYHPEEPHWYLPLIGVDPREQGRGHGSSLLRFALERIDQEKGIAYLENTNPANTPLYERHGFKAIGTIQVDDAPPMISMLRVAK